MKIGRCILLNVAAASLTSIGITYSGEVAASDCEIRDITNRIQNKISTIEDYQFNSTVALDGNKVSSKIKGKSPNLMRIEMNIPNNNTTISISSIFDGNYQWVETKYPDGIDVSKIKLDRLTGKERPFDTSYYIMGTGLVNGESYQASVLTLISVYNLSPTCHPESIELSGPLNVDKFSEYLKSKRFIKPIEYTLNKYQDNFSSSHFVFDNKTMALTYYSLGSIDKPNNFSVHFSDIELNQGLKLDDFTFIPPPGTSVTDITDALLNNLTDAN